MRLRRQRIITTAHATGEDNRAAKYFANLFNKRERAGRPCMPARASTYRNDAVDTLIDCLVCVTNIDDIMKDNATVTVHSIDDFGRRSKSSMPCTPVNRLV